MASDRFETASILPARLFRAAAALLLAVCGACVPAAHTPSVRLALDGPPLYVVAEGEASSLQGVMDRSCLAGTGRASLFDLHAVRGCEGEMDSPATDKARLYLDLVCSDGSTITLALKNLGPDQGMGIGRVITETGEQGDQLTVFYHPCGDEAIRRLAALRNDVAEARTRAAKKTDEQGIGKE